MQNEVIYSLGGYAYNNGLYSKKLLSRYFNTLQKGLELIGFITSIEAICKQRGINLKMFHMFEPWIGVSAGEPSFVHAELLHFGNSKLKDYGVLKRIKKLSSSPLFSPSSLEMLNDKEKYGVGYLKYFDTGKVFEDHHPQSIVHLHYCIKYIYPWLSSLNSTRKVDNIDRLTTNIEEWTEFMRDKNKVESLEVQGSILYTKYKSLVIPSKLFDTDYTEPEIPFKFTNID